MTDYSHLAAEYDTHGFVILRGLYSAAEMAEWKRNVAECVEATASGSGVHVWFLDSIPEYFLRAFTRPTLAEPVKAMIGEPAEFLSAKPVLKSGKVRFASPWHQDYAYWKGAVHKLSIWIAMDPATPENGCLRVVDGGHRAFIDHVKPDDDNAFENRLTADMLPPGEIIDCVLEPGDAIFFHDLLPHSSHPNPQGRDRWSMIPTYRNAAAPDGSTVWTTSTPI